MVVMWSDVLPQLMPRAYEWIRGKKGRLLFPLIRAAGERAGHRDRRTSVALTVAL